MKAKLVETSVVSEVKVVEQRLRELGLSRDGLDQVVRRGELARAEVTPHDAAIAKGLMPYFHRVRALREIFASGEEARWERHSDKNVEYIRAASSPALLVCTATGNEHTGDPRGYPDVKYDMGPNKSRRMTSPEGQLALNPSWLNAHVPDGKESVFILLVNANSDVVRAELSRAARLTDRGRIAAWYERIILPEFVVSDEPSLRSREVEFVDADVAIRRKA